MDSQKQVIKKKQMQDEDFYKPTSIRDTIFAGIDLPETSRIRKPSNNNNKYQQQDNQDDGFDLSLNDLGQVSNIQPKFNHSSLTVIKEASNLSKETSTGILTPVNSNEISTSSENSQNQPSAIVKKPVQQVRKAPIKNKKDTKKPQTNNAVDLDQEIGQVRQWGHRDDDQKSSDFDKSDQEDKYQEPKANKQLQDQLRKKAEEKAKMIGMKIQNKSFGSKPKGLGLLAKAQQLKKKNEENNKNLPGISEQYPHQQSTDNLNIKPKIQSNKQLAFEAKNTEKVVQSKPAKTIKPKFQTKQEQEEDPWEKINQKTKQQYQKKEQRQANPLTKQQIIQFYSKKFIFAEQDIQFQFELDCFDEESIPGCWDMLFGCLKSKDKNQGDTKNNKNNKDRLAMRLVAISKISLSNTDEQFFVLKQIWTKMTNKPFSRYGNHWNQIGFQGRDPATDLRSTGFLSLLQWYQFIDQNPNFAKEIYQWTTETDFPLALTHIKTTGLFLKLIKNGKIRAKTWNQYQEYYNCIAWSGFNRIRKGYDESLNVGQVVDQQLQSIRKTLTQCIKEYRKIKTY